MKRFVLIASCVLSPIVFAQQAQLSNTRPLIFTKPAKLNWRSLQWKTIDYSRTALNGGVGLYTLPSNWTPKFKIQFVFSHGLFSLPQEDRTAIYALADLLILGGTTTMSYEEIQNFLSLNGINLETNITSTGKLMLSADGLKSDYSKTIKLISDILLRPKLDPLSLEVWKQQMSNQFQSLLDSNTLEKQMKLINRQAMALAFGNNHYLATKIDTLSPKKIAAVKVKKVKELYEKIIQKNGLNIFLAGNYTAANKNEIKTLVKPLPQLEPAIYSWIPQRDLLPPKNKLKVLVIQKDHMTQSDLSLQFYFPFMGEFNPIEKVQLSLLEDIFSSRGGIVGNDRFSKALRAESGISYAPYAFFKQHMLYPNTNVGAYFLNFQSPNERLGEAVQLALNTWNDFVEKGVTQTELDNARVSMMNRLLATEQTVFDKMDAIRQALLHDEVPDVDPIETRLLQLEQPQKAEVLNAFLKSLPEKGVHPILVLMGNPDGDQISKINKISILENITQMPFAALQKSFP